MKKYLLIIAMTGLLAACKSKEAGTETETETATKKEAAAGEHEEAGNIVSLTNEQMKTAGIALGKIEMKNLQSSIKSNGTLIVPNQNRAFVTSVNSGVMKTLLIQPGSYVKQGQIIATIINPDAAGIQQQLQSLNAQISLSELEYTRQKELVEGNAAPLKNLQRVQTELATQKAIRKSLQKQLGTMGISTAGVTKGNIVTTLSVTAPISGTVSNVTAQIGSKVDASTPIAEIVNNSQLHLDLFVFEKDLPKLHANQTIHFTLTNNPGKEYDAQVYSIGTAFAAASKTVPIHAMVKGDKTGLIEGMNITAVISIGEKILPAVPNDAIVNYQGQDYIFVVSHKDKTEGKSENKESGEETGKDKSNKAEGDKESETETLFERVPVVKGASDVGYTEITLLKNLPPNAQIITKGAFFALAKMTNVGEEE